MVKVIAEIGCNHKGNFNIAKEMIKVASNCGASIVKFQKRNNLKLLGKKAYNSPHPVESNSYGKTYGLHRDFLEFNINQHKELKRYCEQLGVEYATSVWDIISTKEVVSMKPNFIKIPSATNLDFEIHYYLIKNFKGKIHISLGMTTIQETEEIIEFYKKYKKLDSLVLYACTSGYPVPPKDICLLEINYIINKYKKHVKEYGFSGHHNGIAPDIAALTLGLIQNRIFDIKFNYIERHFTLDRTWKGTDHAASLEPDGIRKLVRDIRNVTQALNYKSSEILDIEWASRQKLKMLTKSSHNNGHVAASKIKSKNSNRPKYFN